MEVTIGPALLARLGPPLSLILASARWFTYEVARRYREAFQQLYGRLVHATGSPTVSLHRFTVRAASLLNDPDCPPLRAVTAELQRRWSEVLGLPSAWSQLQRTTAELRPRVAAAFHAPHPGWPLARYCAPDVMIAAAGAEAIRHGAYQLVLGEVHLGNTLAQSYLFAQHPAPQALLRARALDVPEPCVIPVPAMQWNIQRTTFSLPGPRDILLEYAGTPSGVAGLCSVAIGELEVEDTSCGLRVRTHDGRLTFDSVEFFASTIANRCLSYPAIVPPAPHAPRITIDGVVVSRESWRFDPAEIPRTRSTDPMDQFLQMRRWAQAHRLPRYTFIRVPGERKPYYLDLDSPMFVAMFARLVHRCRESDARNRTVHVVEMLPDIRQTWLPDADAQHYTSELRFVSLDPAPWQPPGHSPLCRPGRCAVFHGSSR